MSEQCWSCEWTNRQKLMTIYAYICDEQFLNNEWTMFMKQVNNV